MLKKILGDNYDSAVVNLIESGIYSLYSIKNNIAKFLLYVPQQDNTNYSFFPYSTSIIPAVYYLLDNEGNILSLENDIGSLELVKVIRNFPDDLDKEIVLSKEEVEQLMEKLEI